jgi:ABC-2 type transport system ATP-binding protein
MVVKKEIAVSINDIHKEFILPQSKNSSFKQTFVNIVKKNNKVTQKVLDGVSFEVNKGDFFGIVGRNGSGKSTLLKLLAGVYVPTSGEIQVNGNLTPFIELGVGFNPELSGRDNVYLNGALLGFNRKQMAEMYDDIVEFAEIEPFMDQKLKNYSSGMQVRLAFSIAIKAKNEVLIFDEVLAVGDEAFQRKCLDVFETYKAEGQTVILVTHDMEQVRRFCNRAALIHYGDLVMVGDAKKVAEQYSKLNTASIVGDIEKKDAKAVGDLKIEYLNSDNHQAFEYQAGDTMRVQIQSKQSIVSDFFVVNIYKRSGEHITGFRIPAKKSTLIEVALLLAPGKYSVLIQQITADDQTVGDLVSGPEFYINGFTKDLKGWSGLIPLDHKVIK